MISMYPYVRSASLKPFSYLPKLILNWSALGH